MAVSAYTWADAGGVRTLIASVAWHQDGVKVRIEPAELRALGWTGQRLAGELVLRDGQRAPCSMDAQGRLRLAVAEAQCEGARFEAVLTANP